MGFLAPRTPAVADGATTLAGHASNGTARVIKVVTDMGFDDWGAFAVLKAAGNEPLAALVTKGMMQPSDFGPNLASLLASWDFSTTVHMGTDKCFDPPCANTSFIEDEWQYPDHVKDYFLKRMPQDLQIALAPCNRKRTSGIVPKLVCIHCLFLVRSRMLQLGFRKMKPRLSALSRSCFLVVSSTQPTKGVK